MSLMARNGHAEVSWRCPLLGEQRKTFALIELFRFCLRGCRSGSMIRNDIIAPHFGHRGLLECTAAISGRPASCDGMFSLESPRFRPDTRPRSLAISNLRRAIMAIQIVMDRTGDSRHPFNPADAHELAEAEQRLSELTKVGFTAAVRTGPGQVSHIRSFDPAAEETLFFPRLVGG